VTDCVVTTPETRPAVLVTNLDRPDLPCSRCGGACGPLHQWAFVITGRAVCRWCVTDGEVADVEAFEQPAPRAACLIPAAHLVEHPAGGFEAECPGCLPAPAAPGAKVSVWHQDITRDRLKGAVPGPGCDRPRTVPSLAELYEALGTAPTGGARDGGEAQVIGDERRNARSAIKAMLVSWCLVLAEERHITVPDEARIIAGTWQAVFNADADAAVATDAARAASWARDREAAWTHRRQSGQHHRRAERLREQRATEADVIEALCDHIDRHLAWLLASEHADQLVNDVAGAWRWAWSLAGGGRNVPTLLCECGVRVPMPLSEDAGERETQEFVCPGCGSWGVLAWWADRLAASPGPMRLSDLVTWLAHWHGIVVTEKQLRNWADRGDITPAEGGGQHGITRRFDPVAVALIAAARVGVTQRAG
jgi:hypothetical protein